MPALDRRRFMGSLALAAGAAASPAEGQAPPERALAEENRRLGSALRELNEAAGLGRHARTSSSARRPMPRARCSRRAAKLRPLVLHDGLDLPVVFRARKVV